MVKNKVAAPFKLCEFDIIFGKGINTAGEILDAAVLLKLVEKAGAWYSTLEGSRIGQGRDKSCQFLRDNPEMLDTLHRQVRIQLGITGVKNLDKKEISAVA